MLAGDFDGDGDLDVITRDIDAWIWYENTDGRGKFVQRQRVDGAGFDFRPTLYVEDLDDDSDLDVIALELGDDHSYVSRFENTDGRGTFGPRQQIGSDQYTSMRIADLDGDGDRDILTTTSWRGLDYSWVYELADVDQDDDLDLIS